MAEVRYFSFHFEGLTNHYTEVFTVESIHDGIMDCDTENPIIGNKQIHHGLHMAILSFGSIDTGCVHSCGSLYR